MKETKAQRDAKIIALRKQIMDIVRQHQPITCYQIAQLVGVDTGKISSCCHGLGRNGFLQQGESVISVYKNKRKTDNYVCTWMVGDDSKSMPTVRKYCDARVTSKATVRKVERDAPVVEKPASPITDEDIEWMNYWRARHNQRYAHREVINDSLTY